MCGIYAVFSNNKPLNKSDLDQNLSRQKWRGPDISRSWISKNKLNYLGHNRLTILDTSTQANQPMRSASSRFRIVYNGEIYNYRDLATRFSIKTKTNSDTELLLELYAKLGKELLNYIEGMFSFVIYDRENHSWFAARDHLGIKPLYYKNSNGIFSFASEPKLLTNGENITVNEEQLDVWRVLRRPIPGYTFFDGVNELKPGHYINSQNMDPTQYWRLTASDSKFCQYEFEQKLQKSIQSHLVNDFETVGLLSGGIDSGLIAAYSGLNKFYSVGTNDFDEFDDARDTASTFSKNLLTVKITEEEMREKWLQLVEMRQEPLSVPNEALIFAVCEAMQPTEKVVLTGEGADELMFGYHNIFRWAQHLSKDGRELEIDNFIQRYGYNHPTVSKSLIKDYISDLMRGKNVIEFLEDFFIDLHLPGLLRRMDGASMAASKEARVPFVTKELFEYCYRREPSLKIDDKHSKIPLRKAARKIGLNGALNRPKIGFAVSKKGKNDYSKFQSECLQALGWV